MTHFVTPEIWILSQACFFDPFSANQVSVFAETLSFLLEFLSFSSKYWEGFAKFIEISDLFDTKYLTQCTIIGLNGNKGGILEKHTYFMVKNYKLCPNLEFFTSVIEFSH